MFDRFPGRIMVAAFLHATSTHGVMLLNVMYNNDFCISIGEEHVNLYQPFACQPQINSCTSIINCTQNSCDCPYKHLRFDDLFCSGLQATLLLHKKAKKHTRGQYKQIIILLAFNCPH